MHPNGAIEITGNRTPREEAEWLSKHNRVSSFPSANHRSVVKDLEKEPPKPRQKKVSSGLISLKLMLIFFEKKSGTVLVNFPNKL